MKQTQVVYQWRKTLSQKWVTHTKFRQGTTVWTYTLELNCRGHNETCWDVLVLAAFYLTFIAMTHNRYKTTTIVPPPKKDKLCYNFRHKLDHNSVTLGGRLYWRSPTQILDGTCFPFIRWFYAYTLYVINAATASWKQAEGRTRFFLRHARKH